jgi:hypothetical protein
VSARTRLDWVEMARTQAARFASKIRVEGACLIWTAGKDKDGYGKFAITRPTGERPKQKHVRAHRIAWEMINGPAPDDLVMMHSCDTPACVAPWHLAPDTQAANRADCGAKGRNAVGERSGKATIDEGTVRAIRALVATGATHQAVADRLGTTRSVVSQVAIGKTWRHVA